MLEKIKEKVYQANIELQKKDLVTYTWGNVSQFDKETGLVVIKPSGIKYENMTPTDMVVVNLNGDIVEGKYKPSSDTPTHLFLYSKFEGIGGITHTHSLNATSFAQAGREIPLLGTTHADYFYHSVPCSRSLNKEEVEIEYEKNTGKVIVETFEKENYLETPGILVKNHGVFSWGSDAEESVHNAVVIEKIAEMAYKTLMLNPGSKIEQHIVNKHYYRKHGVKAYYGQ